MRARALSNVLTVVTAGTLATATPAGHSHHKHGHQHQERATVEVKTIEVIGPTVIAYELDGKPISQDKVCEGIKEGSMSFVDSTGGPLECSSDRDTVSFSQSTPFVEQTASLQELPSTLKSRTSSKTGLSSQPTKTLVHAAWKSSTHQASASEKPSSVLKAASSQNVDGSSNPSGIDQEFPDGKIDCSTFPAKYGPIQVEWAELGGWSGIQRVAILGNSVTHIDTVTSNGRGCQPGDMCSYACPPGYQKSQWPSAQGSTGQSVGGLQCDKHGKLRLTNAKLSKKLCIAGTGATLVENKLSANAAICRTDYPGTENMVVPLNTEPDTINPLTCPDASTYFKHEGSSTTAQYYINNQGIPLQDACIWGSDGTDMGNWAPSYLGVGQDIYGKTYLAIASTAQNAPSGYKPLNYTVEITGHTTGKCRLKHGSYCSGPDYEDCNAHGCTVELLSGQATYVLSN